MMADDPLQGISVPLDQFPRLKKIEILVSDDFPLLILAEGPPEIPETVRKEKKEKGIFPASKWLLNWCDFVEPENVSSKPRGKAWVRESVYQAFKVSENRLTQFLDSHMSLREVILHCEDDLYLLRASDPFHPSAVVKTTPRRLPESYLPLKDFALNGAEIFSIDEARIGTPMKIGFHIIAPKENSDSWATLGPFETFFQRYVGWAAKFIQLGRDYTMPTLPSDDWTNLRPQLPALGSYKIFCTGNTDDIDQSRHIVAAVERLKEITEDSLAESTSGKSVSDIVGKRAAEELDLLLATVSQQRVAVSVRWALGDSSGELTLNKAVADNISNQMKKLRKDQQEWVSITVTLTDDELAALMRPVNGQGGWQTSLRRIQNKFKGNSVTLTAAEVDQIVRQAQNYGQGEFQNRLFMLIQAIKRWESTLSRIR